jgi:hypothetical protein
MARGPFLYETLWPLCNRTSPLRRFVLKRKNVSSFQYTFIDSHSHYRLSFFIKIEKNWPNIRFLAPNSVILQFPLATERLWKLNYPFRTDIWPPPTWVEFRFIMCNPARGASSCKIGYVTVANVHGLWNSPHTTRNKTWIILTCPTSVVDNL